jgi:hypothetical protein
MEQFLQAFEQENPTKFKLACSFSTAVLLAIPQLATAQGPSGGNRAVASIPGSVVRAGEEPHPISQPSILSLIGSPPPLYPAADSKPAMRRHNIVPAPSK